MKFLFIGLFCIISVINSTSINRSAFALVDSGLCGYTRNDGTVQECEWDENKGRWIATN
jgi:hypothetical protein